MDYIQLTTDNIAQEHLCCALSGKQHREGVAGKKSWLEDRFAEGHMFYRLNAKAKVFIEYAPLETAWVPVVGDGYVYIYCLWVAGSHKGKGHGAHLLQHCLDDARRQGKRGVCILSAPKKKAFTADAKFLKKFGFTTVDTAGGYDLMALPFDDAQPLPAFAPSAKACRVGSQGLHIFYSPQCPYSTDCAAQIEAYCAQQGLPLTLDKVDSLEAAKSLPCVFNNWALFYDGDFISTELVNEGSLAKLLQRMAK